MKQTHFWGENLPLFQCAFLQKWMLNNQNSIKVPRGFIRLSLLKVSEDTCRRSAAVFKYGKQSRWIGWPAFTLQKHSVNTDPWIQLPLR